MTKNSSSKKLNSIVLVIAATMLWSIGAPIGKYVQSPALTLIFFRCLSGFFALWVLSLISRKHQFIKFDLLSIGGGVFYAMTSACFYLSLKYTTAANTTVIANTSPFFIALFGFIFLKEKPHRSDWLILLIIFLGIIFCFIGGISLNGTIGDFLAILAAVTFSFLAVIIKKLGPEKALQPIVWGNIIAVVFTAPHLIITKSVVVSDIPLFVILGIFQMVLPFFLYARGQVHLGTMEASLYKLLEPIAAPVWVALLIGEVPSVYTFAGGALVITALFVKTLREYFKARKAL